ncbi:MAG: L,D-transpeptidase family protein [Thermoguttaceae bacterium]
MMEAAWQQIHRGQRVDVLRKLSPLYASPEFTPEESRQLTQLLDQLAGTVIYSRRHELQPAYVVRPGESLQQIAEQWQVPWQLLAKINGVKDPDRLSPGRELKVVRGPFDAIIYLDRYELVLRVDGLYAGRFPIGLGQDCPLAEGDYVVQRKVSRPTYFGANGIIPPGDPGNPLGMYWIGLDDQLGIHGTNDLRQLRRSDGRGTICLGQQDIEDVFDILSARSASCSGSIVSIRRSADSASKVAERDLMGRQRR